MAEVAEWIVDACNGYKRNNDFVKFKCGNRVVDAQVLCVDCNDDRPVLIRYRDDDKWSFYCLPSDGKNETCALLPSLFEGYMNIYPSQGSLVQLYQTKELAERAAGGHAIRVGVHMREVPMGDPIQKGEGSGQGSQTPLVEQLNGVPNDARIEYEHSPTHYQLIPVGRMCRDAAAEIADLEERVTQLESAYATLAGPGWEMRFDDRGWLILDAVPVAQLEADNATLAAECRAVRDWDAIEETQQSDQCTHCFKPFVADVEARDKIDQARAATDAAGALDRAKGGGA